jgi:hypothetical protein
VLYSIYQPSSKAEWGQWAQFQKKKIFNSRFQISTFDNLERGKTVKGSYNREVIYDYSIYPKSENKLTCTRISPRSYLNNSPIKFTHRNVLLHIESYAFLRFCPSKSSCSVGPSRQYNKSFSRRRPRCRNEFRSSIRAF